MGQGASGRLAREQERDSGALRRFLDVFVELDGHQRLEDGLLERLEANSEEINLAAHGSGQLEKSVATVQELEATLQAAQNSKVEELAQYAAQLEAESALLNILDELGAELLAVDADAPPADLAGLAIQTGTDLGRRPAADHVHGTDGVGALLDSLAQRRSVLRDQLRAELVVAGAPLQAKLEAWKVQQAQSRERLDVLRAELEQQGLKVQAGEILKVSRQLNVAREQVRQLTARRGELHTAQRQRAQLLQNLRSNRDAEHQRRKATLRHVVSQVNRQADRLRIHLVVQADADNEPWCRWLRDNLNFRSPRVERVARAAGPAEMAQALLSGRDALAQLTFEQAPLLDGSQLDVAMRSLRTYRKIHALETMRLEDRVRIEVQEPGTRQPRPFDHLSAGEQRSVLLSLMLSADRDEPLMVDQPEDHLDASYIARSIVRQLEAAKEHRQVIIATHSANLTVLGDAELVIPMYAEAGRGHPQDAGAVDRPSTRERVCQLLEGGRDAYRRRGERYGFRISPAVR
jgi:predicted ATPase